MKKGTQFRGIIPPVVSTFTEDEKIDPVLYRREVRYLLDAGVHGISPGGSTGEGAALSDAELAELVTIVKSENREGVPIVAGVARNSTAAAIETAMTAKKAGADALMVTPTFYNVLVPDNTGNKRFYQAISDAVGLPIVIYNVVPQNEIMPDLFSELLDIEHVVGVKQSVGGIMAMYDMVRTCGDRGMIYAATDEMIHSCFAVGADGAISAILALFPRLSVKMWDLHPGQALRRGPGDPGQALPAVEDRAWPAIPGPHEGRRQTARPRCRTVQEPDVGSPAGDRGPHGGHPPVGQGRITRSNAAPAAGAALSSCT